MAVIDYTKTELNGGAVLYKWEGLTEVDSGKPVQHSGSTDRTIQVGGSFGGGTVRFEGALDIETPVYLPLTDPQGNELLFGAEKIEAVSEFTSLIRPIVTAGAGVSLTCLLLVRNTM